MTAPTQPTPAALEFLTDINHLLGTPWALKLATEMRSGFIQELDGVPVLERETGGAPLHRHARHVQGVLTNEVR